MGSEPSSLRRRIEPKERSGQHLARFELFTKQSSGPTLPQGISNTFHQTLQLHPRFREPTSLVVAKPMGIAFELRFSADKGPKVAEQARFS